MRVSRIAVLAGAFALGALGWDAPGPTTWLGPLAGMEAHAEVPPERFGELPLIHDAAISPDGSTVAIYGNIAGIPGVLIYDVATGKMVPDKGFRLGSDLKPGWVKWANNDRLLTQVWTTDQLSGFTYNSASIYSYSFEDAKGDWLVGPRRSRRTGSNLGRGDTVYELDYADVVDWLPDDPAHILMQFADERTGVRSVHKVDVATGAYDTVERATSSIQDWVTDTSGTVRVALGLRRRATKEEDVSIRIRDMDGEWKPLSNWPGIDHETQFFGFTNTPNEMVVGLRNGRDTVGAYIYDLNTRKVSRSLYHDDVYDISGIVRDDKTRDVIGVRYVGEEGRRVLLPGHANTFDEMARQFSDYQLTYMDSSDGGDTLLFTVSQPYDPGALLLARRGDAKPTTLSEVRPGLSADDLGLVIPVRYTARDGQKIPAFVTLPPTVNDTASIDKLPFVVLPHGGPYARDSKRFDYFAQFFASRGYGVLQMNFRGSTGYGEAFRKAGRNDWSLMRQDVVDGADWLVEKGYADPERMCIAGWSFGGYSALMSGVRDADKFQCVVAVASLSDLQGELRDIRFGKIAQRFITDGFRDKADMIANSPVRVADAMTLPTFIAHGTLDVNVDYDQHKVLRRALKKSPAEVTEMTFKGDDHYMSVQDNRQELLRGIAKFLDEVNGPSEYMKK